MDHHKNAPWMAISREQLARIVINEVAALEPFAGDFEATDTLVRELTGGEW